MLSRFGLLLLASVLTGCASLGLRRAETPAERASGFGYIPLDGLPITESADYMTCRDSAGNEVGEQRPLLEVLPDLSVRFAVASFAADGGLTFGPAKVTSAGSTYRAVLDYVNVDAIPVNFYLRKFVVTEKGEKVARKLLDSLGEDDIVVGYEAFIDESSVSLYSADTAEVRAESQRRQEIASEYDKVTIPVYVGIGMRLSADIRALKGGISLTSLGSIAAEAQANALSGTLTVQTLGVTGKGIATALPLPSKLDQTTVENGILALGTSRSTLYANTNDVTLTPRVVGLYSPVGSDPQLINAIYSELSRATPPWVRTCAVPQL